MGTQSVDSIDGSLVCLFVYINSLQMSYQMASVKVVTYITCSGHRIRASSVQNNSPAQYFWQKINQ